LHTHVKTSSDGATILKLTSTHPAKFEYLQNDAGEFSRRAEHHIISSAMQRRLVSFFRPFPSSFLFSSLQFGRHWQSFNFTRGRLFASAANGTGGAKEQAGPPQGQQKLVEEFLMTVRKEERGKGDSCVALQLHA
jgi:hypothetical protein